MPTGVYIRTKETNQKNSEAHKGHKHSEKTKRRMSESHKGENHWAYNKELSEEHKQKISKNNAKYWLGKHLSEETKQKMSKAKKGRPRPQISGNKNGNWKGGTVPLIKRIRNSFIFRQWRDDVFTRDDFTCQECGKRGCYLHVHHIRSFSSILQFYEITDIEEALKCEELWNINNGITLCEECHEKTDNYKNKNR